jgi:hypothetical protein
MALDSTGVVIQCLRQNESAVCARFVHCLAKQLAQVLGALDEHIRAIYVTGDDIVFDDDQNRVENASTIGLLIWREQKAAAFDSLVTDLCRAVAQVYRNTIGVNDLPACPETYVIDDTDLEKLFGSAKCIRACLRQATYLLCAHNELVSIAYTREVLN